ncbi:hypothetical protein PZ938_18230 [Luteipulveratus sp. YIM 133132]|uniref:hypothetical protein n=1 Tax=Luteipulveratus flavus TaxID=3031728 RepID=UPI0023B09CE5|nr:hypothetical protein [Luteipulveratus sp. YIM 133132]MDE9367561.1 hypothetical protein [Luteipulveratus sp. YIM 133132]
MRTPAALVCLVAATWLHLGFQGTVTLLVYPALRRVGPDDWRIAHERHSRTITPVVAVVYLGLVATLTWCLVAQPSTAVVVSTMGALLSVGVTAALAAPLHARLGDAYEPTLLGRLVRVDRIRLVGALIGAAAALVALR